MRKERKKYGLPVISQSTRNGGRWVDSHPITQTVEGDFSAVSTEGAGATLPISVSTLLAACTLSPPRSVLNLASSGSSAAACRRARVRVRVRVGLRLRRNPNYP